MNEQAWLLVELIEEFESECKIQINLHDPNSSRDEEITTNYQILVPKTMLNTADHAPPKALLMVKYMGENNKRASIELPRPILEIGKRITVDSVKIKRT
jgi:hypothetical protein